MHVSLEPEEAVEVECSPLVGLDGPIILADAPKHRVLPDPHVIFEEHGDLPVEEDDRAEGVRYREPDPLV